MSEQTKQKEKRQFWSLFSGQETLRNLPQVQELLSPKCQPTETEAVTVECLNVNVYLQFLNFISFRSS